MSLDKRLKRSGKSVAALFELLKEIAASPQDYRGDTSVVDALSSQGALAGFTSAERGIVACSLNTLKRAAEHSIEGGFGALDSARTVAKEALDSSRKPLGLRDRRNKDGLKKQLAEVKEQVQKLKEDLEILTWALAKALAHARTYAARTNHPATEYLCKKELGELLNMLSFRQRSSTWRIAD